MKNTDHLTEKQKEILREAYQYLDPKVVEQFKTKAGQQEIFKNSLNHAGMHEELNNLKKLDKNLSGEIFGLLDEDKIAHSAQNETLLKQSGEIAPDSALTADGQKSGPEEKGKSENSSQNLDNGEEK
ncbi:hypothetical protein N9N67_09915, partial [Bacteriovoracaceae bacterium]|nr:hypothetical protein [Bacteriovoracaceae bacterium]